jgi:DNA polymerase III epsilon subunit-like protein
MKRVVLDTETTGLRPNHHQVLTIGMSLIDVTPEKLKFVDDRHIFVKHDEYNCSKTAMRITGINLKEHHKIGIFPKLACKRVNQFLDLHSLHKIPIVGHCVHFDKNFLRVMFEDEGLSLPFHEEKEDTRYIWERLKKKGLVNPFSNAKLGTIAEHFGVDYSQAHDALADCKITAKCYHKMLPMMNMDSKI